MNTRDKVHYWLDIADYDLATAAQMQKSGRYLYTVFMCQQAIEKLLKALHLKMIGKEMKYPTTWFLSKGWLVLTCRPNRWSCLRN